MFLQGLILYRCDVIYFYFNWKVSLFFLMIS